jgi:Golgi phosphoprotein 3 (GPP34)
MVTLAEDLYLLSGDGATGRLLIDTTQLDLGLGGAQLLDLVLQQRVALVDDHVAVTDRAHTDDPLLDTALAAMADQARAHEPEYWVRHLARGAHHAVQDRLVAAGVLRRDDHKVLGVIPVHRTPETDHRLHDELVDHLHDAVVLGHVPSRETAALASLALAVGLEQHLFPRSDRRAVRQRMAEVAEGQCPEGHWVAAAVKHTIDAVNAAMGIAPPLAYDEAGELA